MKDLIYNIDHSVGEFFHKVYLWGGEVSNKFMEGVSLLGEAGILFLLIGLGLMLFKRTRKTGGAIILSIAIGFIFTNVVLKNLIERARPFQKVGTDFYRWWLDAGCVKETGFSFPSGHTTAAIAFALAIFLTSNKQKTWPILILPFAMASSRIYLMVHYFSDCVGGLIVGGLAGIIAWIVIKWIYSSKIKLFVWAREFEVFKSKQKVNKTINTSQNKEVQIETQQEYLTQDQEKALNNQKEYKNQDE